MAVAATVNGFDRRCFQIGRGFRALGPPLADNIGERYRRLGDEATQSKQRQAAYASIAAAEEKLIEAAPGGSALKAAQEALSAARASDDADAVIDCLRLVVKAHCLQAHFAEDESTSASEDILRTAEEFVHEEAAGFDSRGIARGVALMRLSLAEIDLQHGGYVRAASAAELVADARKELKQDDLRPLATAALLRGAALAACGDASAQAEATESVQLFRRLGDRIGEAHATHILALATALGGTIPAYEEGLRLAGDALSLYKELELWTCHCSVEVSMMRLRLESERPAEVIQAGEEALALIDGVRCNGMLKLTALGLLCLAHVDCNTPSKAAARVQEMMPQLQPRGPRIHALTLDLLAGVLAEHQPEKAFTEISRALALPSTADEDLEAVLRLRLSMVEVARGNDDEGLRAIERALTLWSQLEERAEAAAAARYLSVSILLRMFDPKDALREASQVRGFFEDEGDKYRAGMALVTVATIATARGGFDEGADSLEFAKDLFDSAKDPRSQALALSTLSELYRRQQRHQEALEVSLRHKALAQESGFKEDEIKALTAITGLHRQLDDFKAAARAAREGLRLARHAGLQEQQVQLLLQCVQCSLTAASYGKARVSRNMMEESVRLAKDAVQLTSGEGGLPPGGWKRQQYGVALYWHANALALSSRDSALAVIAKIDGVCEATGDEELRAYATLLSAQIQLDTDKPAAIALLQTVIQTFKKLGDETAQRFAEEVYTRATYVPVAAPRQALPDAGEPQQDQLQIAPAAPKLSSDMVRAQIIEIASAAVISDGAIALDQPLMDLGMDSLTSVSFRNELAQKFKVELPVSLIFDAPTINDLTSAIMDEVAAS